MGVASRVTKMIANLGCGNVTIAMRAEWNLIKYGRRAAPYLVAACSDLDPDVRFRAVWALGKIGGPVGLEAIAELCRDPDERVCYDARVAMGHFGDERGIPVLVEQMIADPGGGAEEGLALLGELAADNLLPLLAHDDAAVRLSAAHLLALTMSPGAMPQLREVILHDGPNVACAAIDGIDSGQAPGWREFLLEMEACGPKHVADYIQSTKVYWSS